MLQIPSRLQQLLIENGMAQSVLDSIRQERLTLFWLMPWLVSAATPVSNTAPRASSPRLYVMNAEVPIPQSPFARFEMQCVKADLRATPSRRRQQEMKPDLLLSDALVSENKENISPTAAAKQRSYHSAATW